MYKSLQAGRAAAALLVVLFHLGVAVAAEKYFGIAAFAVPFSFGTAGVEFFFVLSGFIILTVHREDIGRPGRLAEYLRKRLVRIYPTYWMIFLAACLGALASNSDAVPRDALALLKALLLVPQQPVIADGTTSPVITVAWTLQYEMLFYLFFGLLILSRALAGIALAALALLLALAPPAFPWSFFMQDYLWLFAMGMAVAALCRSQMLRTAPPLLYAGLGAALFLAIALDVVAGAGWFGGWRTLLYGLASSAILFGLVRAEDQGRVIGGQRWMQTLGDASYVLYLIHYPLISVLCKLALLLRLDRLGLAGAVISYAAMLCACLACAVAFHLWIEKPVTRALRGALLALATLRTPSAR